MSAPVVAVTVLEDRASITRRGTFALTTGQQRIVIERVSPLLVDKTLTATCSAARVLDVRCERYVAPWRESEDRSPPAALREQRIALEDKRPFASARSRLSSSAIRCSRNAAGGERSSLSRHGAT